MCQKSHSFYILSIAANCSPYFRAKKKIQLIVLCQFFVKAYLVLAGIIPSIIPTEAAQ